MKNFLVFCAFLIGLSGAVAQTSRNDLTISARVIDSSDNDPIPFVNIGIVDSYIGTSSNHAGEFELKLPGEMEVATLKFSCIGYKSQEVSVSEIQRVTSIFLERDTVEMYEFTVRDKELSSLEVLRSAFQNKRNVFDQSHSLFLYYEGEALDDNEKCYYNVDLILKHSFLYNFESNDISYFHGILQKRNNLSEHFAVHHDFLLDWSWNFYDLMEFHHCNLHDDGCNDKLVVEDYVLDIYDDILCYKIDYEIVNPDKKNTRSYCKGIKELKGQVYITVNDFGILRWEIDGNYDEELGSKQSIKFKKGSSMANIKPINYQYVRNYRFVENHYFLSRQELIRVDWVALDHKVTKKIRTIHVANVFDVLIHDEEEVNRIKNEPVYSNIEEVQYDSVFWSEFNFEAFR